MLVGGVVVYFVGLWFGWFVWDGVGDVVLVGVG